MRLTIYCDGSLVVTVPRKFSMDLLEKFILDKYSWIIQKINYFKIRRDRTSNENLIASSKKEYQKHKKTANELVLSRIRHYNKFYKFDYGRIVIRYQKSRWGSCSRNGTLSFNYKIVFLPRPLADYVIVHELCHLREFNHSPKFWLLVGKAVPGYKNQLILNKAEGNPFFLEELLRSLIDSGMVLLDGDRAIATKSISQLEVPDTLQGVIAERIDRLAFDDKYTLQTASGIGRVFQQGVLGYLLQRQQANVILETTLTELQQRELIRWRGDLE